MYASYRILDPNELQGDRSHRQFALDVGLGLSQSPKMLSSKYIYDNRGSELFQRIMNLPEYYLTNCELEILEACKEDLCGWIGKNRFNLVELGAGDGKKTRILLDAFSRKGLDFRYVPIDISEAAMAGLIDGIGRDRLTLEIDGLVTEYFDGLNWLSKEFEDQNGVNLVLFLGSNIGNFNRSEARSFLFNLWSTLNNGDFVLIGFDLKKSIQKLIRAYNDSQGITADFNRNLLRRINTELGGEFELAAFDYFSTYNAASGAVESYLISTRPQIVYIDALNHAFPFASWEGIHTESSYKYLESEILELAQESGFEIVYQGFDSQHLFVDSLWQVRKRGKPF